MIRYRFKKIMYGVKRNFLLVALLGNFCFIVIIIEGYEIPEATKGSLSIGLIKIFCANCSFRDKN